MTAIATAPRVTFKAPKAAHFKATHPVTGAVARTIKMCDLPRDREFYNIIATTLPPRRDTDRVNAHALMRAGFSMHCSFLASVILMTPEQVRATGMMLGRETITEADIAAACAASQVIRRYLETSHSDTALRAIADLDYARTDDDLPASIVTAMLPSISAAAQSILNGDMGTAFERITDMPLIASDATDPTYLLIACRDSLNIHAG